MKTIKLITCFLAGLLLLGLVGSAGLVSAQTSEKGTESSSGIAGPFVDPLEAYPHEPAVLTGSLSYQPHIPAESAEPLTPVVQPLRYLPGQSPKAFAPQNAAWIDPVAQVEPGAGSMPEPLAGFPGLNFTHGGSKYFPPDPIGDVGPDFYIQAVNVAVGIFDRQTGSPLYIASFNDFFTGPAETPCDAHHRGDPVVLYDTFVDRWLVTDFAWYDQEPGFYQCLAVSRGPDPVTDGWYFYALRADTGNFERYLNDYPKLGVWHDGWYMTANMFEMITPFRFGVRVWALDRQRMIQGLPLREIHYDLCTFGDCGSLLPAHDNLAQASVADLPPNYLLAARLPDELMLWSFIPDFNTPVSSSFIGPTLIQVAPFVMASSIPQPEQAGVLDSLSFRLMMQLQYRFLRGVESLWLNHTVASSGLAAVRWYEIQQPASPAPVLAQQGTYQPEGLEAGLHRWMASLAVDQDGNMAIGYSAASETVYPSIRVAGRLYPETSGLLPQNEVVVQPGAGSQSVINRWGDYTAMTVAPDGCTFYYTNEYFLETGTNWQTWIVPFRFPSCGMPKGFLMGTVRDASTGQALSGISVRAASLDQTVTVLTGANGDFSLELAEGEYTLTAGPQLPGYPIEDIRTGVEVLVGETSSVDLSLIPYPALTIATLSLQDSGASANGNGAPEPGESNIALWVDLRNDGAATAANITSDLTSDTPGVVIENAFGPYPDIQPGETMTQIFPYTFSLDPGLVCGAQLAFSQVASDNLQTYTHSLNFDAAQSLDRRALFTNNVEYGSLFWRSEGVNDTWAITSSDGYYSPVHAWSDSPGTSYLNHTDASLASPVFNLAGKRRVMVEFALKYSLEPGWDFLYLEYSIDGGQTWQPEPLAFFTGFQAAWQVQQVEAFVLDGQSQAALRFRLWSDMSVVYDGVVLDDISLTYEPFDCQYPIAAPPPAPVPLKPMAGELFRLTSMGGVTFGWMPGPSGASEDGYRLFIDGSQVNDLPAEQTEVRVSLDPGDHIWTVQAYNEFGESPLAALTWFFNPFIQIVPLVFR
jgi:hypothetical protein